MLAGILEGFIHRTTGNTGLYIAKHTNQAWPAFSGCPPLIKKRKRGGWPYLAQGYQVDQAKGPRDKQNNSACLVQCHQEMRRVPRSKERLTLPKSNTNSITGTTMIDKEEMVLPRSCLSGKGAGRETWQCVRSCLRYAPCFYLSQLLTAGP